jgi:hypothetical protein
MTDTTTYTIRQATIRDAAIIAHHRVAMFRDMGDVPTKALAAELLSTSTTALTAPLSEGSYVGWLRSIRATESSQGPAPTSNRNSPAFRMTVRA